MPDMCPICQSPLGSKEHQPPKTGEKEYFNCLRCGEFVLSRSLLQGFVAHRLLKDDPEKIAILSYSIRKMQRKSEIPYLDSYLVDQLLQNSLPSLSEQIDNFILWLGDETEYGETVWVEPSSHQSIMGAKTNAAFVFVLKYLLNANLIDGELNESIDGSIGQVMISLSFDGWKQYDNIRRQAVDSRRVFMAMKYGDPDLDQIVNEYFKPAIATTGFELYRLDEAPKAGLIDDRLRIEIRTSRFLLSDLTHENAGAYWEAGFAEGLGKPVIYTCEKSKFEKQKTHFDTNHHLTVIWDKDNPQMAAEQLKATIRATFPDEAILTDE
jgi:hypothetical protein